MAKLMGRGNSAPEGHSAVRLESPSCPLCSQNVQLVSRHLSSCGDTRTFWFKHSPEAVVPYYLVQVRPPGMGEGICVPWRKQDEVDGARTRDSSGDGTARQGDWDK